MEPLYIMSKSELRRLEVVQNLESGQIRQGDAAARLGISVRQVKRLVRAFRALGPGAVVSKRRGQPSNNRTDPALVEAAIGLVRDRYFDFGPTLACEKLNEYDGISIKRERLRLAMIEAGLWSTKRRRRAKVHAPRDRRAQVGELVQGDGSPHDWFGGRGPRCSLLLFIDDATSAVGAALFTRAESTQSYFDLIEQYIELHGKPRALYVDKLAVFHTSQATSTNVDTQFGRAMRELDIELICANSPQAKGRVERANRTFQDRLAKELRIENVSSIIDANAFLPRFVAQYNRRFAVTPRSDINAHRPLELNENLQNILVQTVERKISKNLTLRHGGKQFQLVAPGNERRLQFQLATIRERNDAIIIEHRGVPINYIAIELQQRPAIDRKTINVLAEDRTRLGPRIPDSKRQTNKAPNHPWRTYVQRPA